MPIELVTVPALANPKSKDMADGLIAAFVGVHINTVAKYRAKATSRATITRCDSRTGRDGPRSANHPPAVDVQLTFFAVMKGPS